jgi:hypothetical protein
MIILHVSNEVRNLTNENDCLSKKFYQYKQLILLDKKVFTDTEHVKQLQRHREAVSVVNDDSRLTKFVFLIFFLNYFIL